VRITCPILKSPEPSRAFLVSYSLYKLDRIGDRHGLCLTPLPDFTLLSRHVQLALRSMYNFLISHPSRQSVPVPSRICINLVQLTRSNTFYQSMKDAYSYTTCVIPRRSHPLQRTSLRMATYVAGTCKRYTVCIIRSVLLCTVCIC
jgi:hypothetical protein